MPRLLAAGCAAAVSLAEKEKLGTLKDINL
jgi:hypothetical protein